MKTKKENTVKSELQYYKEIREYSARDLSLMRRFIKVMFVISSEWFMFSMGIIIFLAPMLIYFNLSSFKDSWALIDMNIVLMLAYPVIYHFRMRKRVHGLREEAHNAKRAYETVMKEKSQSSQ